MSECAIKIKLIMKNQKSALYQPADKNKTKITFSSLTVCFMNSLSLKRNNAIVR